MARFSEPDTSLDNVRNDSERLSLEAWLVREITQIQSSDPL